MDYDKLIQSLRVCGSWEGSCDGCKEYDGNGCEGSPEKLMTEAADAIEFFQILANNYGKALEAMG